MLQQRGVVLSLSGNSSFSVTATVDELEMLDPTLRSPNYQLSQETRDEVFITMKRSDLGAIVVSIGDTFIDKASSCYYRVTRVIPRGADPLVKFRCESVVR